MILNQSVTAVAPGSWAYLQRGQPNGPTKNPVMEVTADVKNTKTTEGIAEVIWWRKVKWRFAKHMMLTRYEHTRYGNFEGS